MAYAGGDRIKEICNSPGASAFVLTGAVDASFRAFTAAEDGQYLRYLAAHATGTEREIGAGLYTHSTRTLTRLHRSYPSEGAGTVTFSSGVVHVGNTPSVRDVVPFQSTSNPTSGDDIADGFIRGNRWINTTSGAVFECVSPAPGAAVWDQLNGAGGGGIGTTGSIVTGDWPRFTSSTVVEGRNDAELVAQIASLFPTAPADYLGEGAVTMAAAFAAKASTQDIPSGELASQNEADLPAAVADFRGTGSETLLAALTALAGAAGLSPVDDAGTAVSIGAATNGTLRFLLSDSAITVTLLANAPAGARIIVGKAGAGTVTVNCQAAQASGSGAGYFVWGDDQGGTKATTSFTVEGWCELRVRQNTDGDSAVFVVDGVGLSLPTILAGPVTFADAVLSAFRIRDYAEVYATQPSVNGPLTINFALASHHRIFHNALGNITGTTIDNWPTGSGRSTSLLVDYVQDSVGGRTVVHPVGTIWINGTPTFNTAANKVNRVLYTTVDAGTAVIAAYGGNW